MSSVGVAIQYSTQDQIFIDHVIEQSLKFSEHVVVVYMDRFFDGKPEDKKKIKETLDKWEGKVIFQKLLWVEGKDAWFFHGCARRNAWQYLQDKCEYTLFLDSDEIPEGDLFAEFIKWGLNVPAYKMANYVYYGKPTYRANTFQDSIVLTANDVLSEGAFFDVPRMDRNQLTFGTNMRNTTLRGRPMFHHYSWAKPIGILEQKVASWGHKNDSNWQPILDTIASFDGSNRDLLWGYEYTEIEDKYNLLQHFGE